MYTTSPRTVLTIEDGGKWPMGIWPPANFTDWTPSRIAPLAFLAIVLILCAIPPVRKAALAKRDGCRFVLQAVLLGLLCGLFVHFWPCIWWTCDWGPNDGAGIRGGIWFILWAVVTSGIFVLHARRAGREAGLSHVEQSSMPAVLALHAWAVQRGASSQGAQLTSSQGAQAV